MASLILEKPATVAPETNKEPCFIYLPASSATFVTPRSLETFLVSYQLFFEKSAILTPVFFENSATF